MTSADLLRPLTFLYAVIQTDILLYIITAELILF